MYSLQESEEKQAKDIYKEDEEARKKKKYLKNKWK